MPPHDSVHPAIASVTDNRASAARIALIAVFAIGSVGSMLTGVKPVLVTAYTSKLEIHAAGAGLLVGIEMAAFALGSALVSWRLYAAPRTWVATAALTTLALGQGLAVFAASLSTMGLARVVAGLGGGASGQMAAALSNMAGTERRFGQYLGAALVVSGAISWFAGSMLRAYGAGAMFMGLAARHSCQFRLHAFTRRYGGSRLARQRRRPIMRMPTDPTIGRGKRRASCARDSRVDLLHQLHSQRFQGRWLMAARPLLPC